jgi:type IV pilus assembly protein PilN
MIRINLLPHREMLRERRKKDFIGLATLSLLLAGGASLMVALLIGSWIDAQDARNAFIVKENAVLDAQIKEIGQLKQEIEALTARQEAVENLQRNRTIPVHVLDELVKQTPTGIYFRQLRQDDRKVTLSGWARSNEHVSTLLRSLANDTPWLERPELVEIKASSLPQSVAPPSGALSKDARRVFEFSMTATVKAPAAPDTDKPSPSAAAKAPPAAGVAGK